jgi:hypothetical protein
LQINHLKLYQFRQFHNLQLDSQLSCQTAKLRTAAFPPQQLSVDSSFPCTASQPQPKQTAPKEGEDIREHLEAIKRAIEGRIKPSWPLASLGWLGRPNLAGLVGHPFFFLIL